MKSDIVAFINVALVLLVVQPIGPQYETVVSFCAAPRFPPVVIVILAVPSFADSQNSLL
jgi:hypothetical protein